MEGEFSGKRRRRKRAETLRAMRTLKDYEVYLREQEVSDVINAKKKKKRAFAENMAYYKLQSDSESSDISMGAIRAVAKKLKRIEHQISNIKMSVINDIFDIDKQISYDAFRGFIDIADPKKSNRPKKKL